MFETANVADAEAVVFQKRYRKALDSNSIEMKNEQYLTSS